MKPGDPTAAGVAFGLCLILLLMLVDLVLRMPRLDLVASWMR
jgi:hypothetical protein